MAHLSIFSKLVLLLKLLIIVPNQAAFNVICMLPVAISRGLPVAKYLIAMILRTLLQTLSPYDIQYMYGDDRETYKQWVAKKHASKRTGLGQSSVQRMLKHDVETLDDQGASIMWIGDRTTAKKIILFIHGGGYVFPVLDGHLEWCFSYVKATAGTQNEIAVAVLQYTLYPAAGYPTQLQQAAHGLQHLLDAGHKAENIIIGGDSAGGQIAACLLWHLVRPHERVERIKGFKKPLAGCFLVSPWISSKDGTEAYKVNRSVDMLSIGILQHTHKCIVDGSIAAAEVQKGYGWILPGDVDATWCDNLHTATSHLYITAGEQELLRDGCIALAQTVEQRNVGRVHVTLEVPKTEAHDFILLEGSLGVKGDATRRMLQWIHSIL